MRHLLTSLVVAPLVAVACVAGTTTGTSGGLVLEEAGSEGGTSAEGGEPEEDAGTTTKKDSGSTAGLNPYGVPYPTDSIGMAPRAGARRGDRVGNLTFQGFRPGSTTQESVSLADLYDPQGKTHDVVYVYAASLWSANDQPGLDKIKASTKRIAILAVLGEGTTPGAPATTTQLAAWRSKNSTTTAAIDSGFAKLGPYFDAAAVPFVMLVDARTMEIVSAGVGAPSSTAAIDTAVTAVTSRAPSY